MNQENLNYFSQKEKNAINKFKNLRNSIFLPVSTLLMKLKFTANAVSYIGLFLLTGFVYYATSDPIIASVFLFLHVVIDAFDGPLARLMKCAGNSGAFTDMICDHTGMVTVIVTLIWKGLVNATIAAAYIYIYTILIVFVIIRNKMGISIKFVIRTKYYVYILYGLYAFLGLNYLNTGLLIFSILMVPPLFTSYFIIKKTLH